MDKKNILMFFLCLAVLGVAVSSPIRAQQDPALVAPTPTAVALQTTVDPVFSGSLFFTPVELQAIQRALSGQVSGTAALTTNSNTVVIPARRVIALAGVIYKGPSNWIIWLNGRKVTPKELLPEIMDIHVDQDRVSLKWFDIGINNVISLTLRPHQTYDIVTGLLLPG